MVQIAQVILQARGFIPCLLKSSFEYKNIFKLLWNLFQKGMINMKQYPRLGFDPLNKSLAAGSPTVSEGHLPTLEQVVRCIYHLRSLNLVTDAELADGIYHHHKLVSRHAKPVAVFSCWLGGTDGPDPDAGPDHPDACLDCPKCRLECRHELSKCKFR
ncbi:unnamed protein product [Cuscuta europaea]|uniref:Uncharacterized protein n=1 Tax=Cuscuta europaea TaxID=41803 RepID=A0A9P0ZCN6_CUSEU|nr:unnamed protein product [Cuscuta europaea]